MKHLAAAVSILVCDTPVQLVSVYVLEVCVKWIDKEENQSSD